MIERARKTEIATDWRVVVTIAQFAGPTALAAGVWRSGRWESALWVIVGVNAAMMALALLLRRQEKLVVVV